MEIKFNKFWTENNHDSTTFNRLFQIWFQFYVLHVAALINSSFFFQVRILYVRNLMLSTTEETIEQQFNAAIGKENAVERVKKLRDYAFVHFREREDALTALETMNGQCSSLWKMFICTFNFVI